MSQCHECEHFYPMIDTVRCNTCNVILCIMCIDVHVKIHSDKGLD